LPVYFLRNLLLAINMFELPSLWNLIVSAIVFFIAAWYIRRYLDEQGIPKGATRGILVFTLASVVSWGAGEAFDRVQGKPAQPAAQADLSQLLKAAGPAQP
jgi:predicted PurR-regulated permease PerM